MDEHVHRTAVVDASHVYCAVAFGLKSACNEDRSDLLHRIC